MPYIMNCLTTDVRTQAHGQWFVFKPLQIKEIQNKDLANFLEQNRGEEGLIGIADYMMDQDHNSIEFKAYVDDRRAEGVKKRISKLDWVIRNLRESLRYDLQIKGIKTDALAFASKGELAAIKERTTLQDFERIQNLNVAEEVKKQLAILDGTAPEETLNGSGSSTQPTENTAGRTSTPQPTQGRK